MESTSSNNTWIIRAVVAIEVVEVNIVLALVKAT